MKILGGMNVVGSDLQKKEGVEDSVELFKKDLIKSAGGMYNEKLVDILCKQSLESLSFLEEMGIKFAHLQKLGGHSASRTLLTKDCNEVVEKLSEKIHQLADEARITVLPGYQVLKVSPHEQGVDLTLMTEHKGLVDPVISGDAVILATGGFHGNLDMLSQIHPNFMGVTSYAKGASIGHARANMSLRELGAKVAGMKNIQFASFCAYEQSEEGKPKDLDVVHEMIVNLGAILIDESGARFINESFTQNTLTSFIIDRFHQLNPVANKSTPTAFLVFPQKVLHEIQNNLSSYFGLLSDKIEKFENFEDFISRSGVNEKYFSSTIQEIDNHLQGEEDDLVGRKDFAARFNRKDPFYRLRVTPGIHRTLGGFVIDANCSPLFPDYRKIMNVFLAGSITSGIHGNNILTGNSLLESVVFGRIAAHSAARGVPRKK